MATDVEQTNRERRAGENQALFREVNERINAAKEARSVWVNISEWVCECADESCTERIEMTPKEYEELRANPTHFAVAPAEMHVVPEVERVVEKRERYWVVEKGGEAAEVAEQLDIR
jgi:hypothetical protein